MLQGIKPIVMVALDRVASPCVAGTSYLNHVLCQRSLRDQPDDLEVATCQAVFGLAVAIFSFLEGKLFCHADFCLQRTRLSHLIQRI